MTKTQIIDAAMAISLLAEMTDSKPDFIVELLTHNVFSEEEAWSVKLILNCRDNKPTP